MPNNKNIALLFFTEACLKTEAYTIEMLNGFTHKIDPRRTNYLAKNTTNEIYAVVKDELGRPVEIDFFEVAHLSRDHQL